MYSSVVVRRIFCFPLVLTVDARTGFSTCNFDANNWLTLFRTEKTSRGWSFWSIIRTKPLSCSCFFLLLVEVRGGGEDVGDVEDIGAEGSSDKEGEKEEEERPCLSLSA